MVDKLSREELAALEVGHTTVSRSLSFAMVLCFALLIVSVPLVQTIVDWRSPDQQSMISSLRSLAVREKITDSSTQSLQPTLWQQNNRLLARMDIFEEQLEEDSFLRTLLLAPGQRLLLALGYGNEKVYPGSKDWLFYRLDMDYLMGPGFLNQERLQQRQDGGKVWEKQVQPDPVQTILDFQHQLAGRGIQLILMPTPIKASLHPEYFVAGSWHSPLQNRSWPTFLKKMQQASVSVFDPAPILIHSLKQVNAPVYLQTDTHWRPEAMEDVAEQLAAVVRETVSITGKAAQLKRREVSIKNKGDIDAMLRLPENRELYAREDVTIHPVLTRAEELWQPTADAEVLLLGDSFANIYSLEGMGWGEGAGLGEQLSYFLDQPVDVLLQNDAGAFATRELLSRELARGRDRLAGKKVVIWQFASRELSSGDWKKISMTLQARQESDFYVPSGGEAQKVSGIVAAISSSPLPGSVPYKDNIITLHLVDIRNSATGEEYGQALVYGWGMRNNTLTGLARAWVGEQIDLELVDWDAVQAQYSSYRRSTLDDEMLELELPVWGEIKP
jgi:alginate O-acetyltransferase complex protein AlgJ